MIRCVPIVLVAWALAACSPPDVGQRVSENPAGQEPHNPATGVVAGKQAYEKACAGCHEEGTEGAPAVGDRSAWEGRSTLWVAVLAKHARDGYLDMPSKGGDPTLTDQEVAAAAEYMLTLTHPGQLPD